MRLPRTSPRHEFWPDDVPYTDVPVQGIVGHRQVTDAYLAQLARSRGARLATFDDAMAKLHHDVADLVRLGRLTAGNAGGPLAPPRPNVASASCDIG